MRKIFYCATILACLAVAYYFVIFLPKVSNLKMLENCSKTAKEFFNERYNSAVVNYTCNYNKKLNKCLIVIDNSDLEVGDILVFDAY